MKIYLAGNMPMLHKQGRERETCSKFPRWRRLISFHFLEYIEKSEILDFTEPKPDLEDEK